MGFKFIDEPKEVKRKAKPKRLNDKQLRDSYISDKELIQEYEEFKNTYSKAYEYKIALMNDSELIIELIYMLTTISTMTDPLIDSYGENAVIAHQTKYAGYVTHSVKQNVMTREKARLLKLELSARFSNIVWTQFEIDYVDIHKYLADKCKEYNAQFTTSQFNLEYLLDASQRLELMPSILTNGCNDCVTSIRMMIDMIVNLKLILSFSSLIELQKMGVKEGKLWIEEK